MNTLVEIEEIIGDLIQASFDAGYCSAKGEINIYSHEDAILQMREKKIELFTKIENILKEKNYGSK